MKKIFHFGVLKILHFGVFKKKNVCFYYSDQKRKSSLLALLFVFGAILNWLHHIFISRNLPIVTIRLLKKSTVPKVVYVWDILTFKAFGTSRYTGASHGAYLRLENISQY